MAKSKNSFNGIIDEIPQISVDNFEKKDKKAYFLSHCHTDHTNGLFYEDFIKNLVETNSYVYMSEPSAVIIKHEKNDHRLEKHIRSLKLGRTPIIIPGENDSQDVILNVTLIPAGHCFGSVMILFKINNKNILYTGDFRINANDIAKYKHFHNHGEPITVDALYVDTTFQDTSYENFPKRSESVDFAVNEIKKWLQSDENNRIALNTSARYGYEYVFNEIYEQLKVKVYVKYDKWRLYSMYPSLVPGVTNNENETRIHLCQNRFESQQHKTCYPNENNKKHNYLHIKFSAMIWKDYELDTAVGDRVNNSLKIIFATHCCRRELQCFINYFDPIRVVGFPEPYAESPKKKDDVDKVLLKKRIISPRKHDKCRKPRKLVDSSVLKDIFD